MRTENLELCEAEAKRRGLASINHL
jgi:hypothetical protein